MRKTVKLELNYNGDANRNPKAAKAREDCESKISSNTNLPVDFQTVVDWGFGQNK